MGVPFSYDDYDISQVVIVRHDGSQAKDIKDLCASVDLYESIFSPFATGSLSIVDAIGFFNRFPIIGQETVIISLSVNNKIFSSIAYRVVSIDDKKDIRNQYSSYKLSLAAPEFVKNISEKIDQAYRDTPDNIIDTIFNDFLFEQKNITELDEAVNRIHANFNNKNPMKAIQTLTSTAISGFADAQDMFFYENIDITHGFKFKSVGDLYSRASPHPEYNVDPSIQVDSKPEGPSHVDSNRHLFTYARIRDASSAIKQLNKGAYASKSSTFDITRNLIKRKENNISEEFDKMSIPHDMKVFADNYYPLEKSFDQHFEALYRIHDHSTEQFNPNVESINESVVDTNLGRYTILNGLLGFRLEVRTYANLDFKVGDTVNIGWIAPWQEGPNDTPDVAQHEWQSVKGKFLITGVHHKLTYDDNDTFLELSKLGADTDYGYLG